MPDLVRDSPPAVSRVDMPKSDATARAGDAVLMAAIGRGDRKAFQQVYETHRVRAFRLAYGVLLDRDEAREVVQEAFFRLHENASRWEANAAIGTWLHRVVLNHCLGLKRRLLHLVFPRDESAGEERISHEASPERAASLGQAMEIVFATLAALPPRQRAVLTLFLEGESKPREIARLVGLSPNATRVTLHRALERIRAELAERGIDSASLPEYPTQAAEERT